MAKKIPLEKSQFPFFGPKIVILGNFSKSSLKIKFLSSDMVGAGDHRKDGLF